MRSFQAQKLYVLFLCLVISIQHNGLDISIVGQTMLKHYTFVCELFFIFLLLWEYMILKLPLA